MLLRCFRFKRDTMSCWHATLRHSPSLKRSVSYDVVMAQRYVLVAMPTRWRLMGRRLPRRWKS